MNSKTNNTAREYFKDKGLSYNDITEGDILALVMMLNAEIKKSNKEGCGITTLSLSKKVDVKKNSNGSIISCFLHVNSHYFTRRECISFNEDGFIGIAGWADDNSARAILQAFFKWCDYLSTEVEA